jgi:hypothetical protein
MEVTLAAMLVAQAAPMVVRAARAARAANVVGTAGVVAQEAAVATVALARHSLRSRYRNRSDWSLSQDRRRRSCRLTLACPCRRHRSSTRPTNADPTNTCCRTPQAEVTPAVEVQRAAEVPRAAWAAWMEEEAKEEAMLVAGAAREARAAWVAVVEVWAAVAAQAEMVGMAETVASTETVERAV